MATLCPVSTAKTSRNMTANNPPFFADIRRAEPPSQVAALLRPRVHLQRGRRPHLVPQLPDRRGGRRARRDRSAFRPQPHQGIINKYY